MIELIAVLLVAAVIFFVVKRRRGGQTPVEEPQERTIDGKVVPEKLAVSALAIPRLSPDGQYVLRGLPDYGKALLKLDSAAFEYQPDAPENPYEAPPAYNTAGTVPASSASVTKAPSPKKTPFEPESQPVSAPIFSSEKAPENSTWALWRLPAIVLGVVVVIVIAVVAFGSGSSHSYASYQESAAPIAAASTPAPDPAPVASSPGHSPGQIALPTHKDAGDEPETHKYAWSDPATNLMWAKYDIRAKEFSEAENDCTFMSLAHGSGWRLPTYSELETLWHEGSNGTLPSGIRLSLRNEVLYSSTPDGAGLHKSMDVGTIPDGVDVHNITYAVCVHD